MKIITGLVFLFSIAIASGQSADPEPPLRAGVSDSLIGIYKAGLGTNLPLYNGRQFYGYPANIKEHAFYPVKEWSAGLVRYENVWYNNVSLMYDAHKDELIVRHPNGIAYILFSDRVQEFSVKGLVFVRLNTDKDQHITKGFYQRLSAGRVTLFVKRSKILEEKIIGLEVERKFLTGDQFYLLKDNRYTLIKRKQSLMGVLKDKHSELKQQLGRLAIRYKTDPEAYIRQATEFYNKLYP